MASVPYIKGVRTRYRNTLEKELDNIKEYMQHDVSTFELSDISKQLQKSKCLLKTYLDKLMVQMEKLSQCLDESESDYLEQALDEDCQLHFSVEECLIEIDHYSEELCSKVDKKASLDSETSDTTRLVSLQESMHKLMASQMEHQTEFLAHMDRKEKMQKKSVKLPKFEMSTFYGNKLQWLEFWDAFECTIHANSTLSDVEKFNYLQSKLGGEAKRTVAGLSRSNKNYELAVKLLHERYGNQQEIVDLHYKALMNLQSPSNKVESLRSFIDATEKHLRSLDVLGENVNQHVFVSMIHTKLPEEVLRQLEFNKGARTEWTLANLRVQLKDFVVACERAEKKKGEKVSSQNNVGGDKSSYRHNSQTQRNQYSNMDVKTKSSAESLFTNDKPKGAKSDSKPNVCRYCSKSHWSDECKEFKTIEERKKKIKGCCYKCLKSGHIANECKTSKKCIYCGGFNQHHRSLCPVKFSTNRASLKTSVNLTEAVDTSTEDMVQPEENVMVSVGETVFMQTATTEVKENPANTECMTTRILLDCGSQRTYIAKSLSDKLGLKPERIEELKVATFGSSHSKTMKTELTTLYLKLKNGEFMKIKANIVPVISGNIQRKTFNIKGMNDLDHIISSVNLADTLPTKSEMANVELLLGNDYYLDVVLSQKLEVLPGLYLLSSKLGWILAGRAAADEENHNVPNMLILTHGACVSKTNVFQSVDSVLKSEHDLEDFWRMESIGVIDKPTHSDDDTAMQLFKKNTEFIDNRYQVTWPWKPGEHELPKNRELAYCRLKSCVEKLKAKPELLQKYDSVIQDQFQRGIIEKVSENVSDGPQHYLPHHAVVNFQRTSTKLRVVFDASAKLTKDSNSLNDCLYRGPVLLHDLCGLLMRFRLHTVALVADIEKAFLQVALQPSERDVTRFFWIKDTQKPDVTSENLQVFRFCRVPFGVISSPFLLAATVEKHLDSYGTDVSKKLKDDIYVDNIVTGANNDKEAIHLYRRAKSIFSEASMNLREWLSNSERVNQYIPMADRAELKEMKVLGYIWDCNLDTLSVKDLKDTNDNQALTKRNILKRIASVFDPLGLFSPVVLQGKVLLQNLWSKGVDWDQMVNDDETKQLWSEIDSELKDIPNYKVDRCLSNLDMGKVSYSLLCFCDASTVSYAAAVYLHQEGTEETKTDLVFAKTRLAPVKKLTVPKLELMAVLIGVRCLNFVKTQLKIEIAKEYLWSDSQVVLGWLNSDKKLPVFVKNRVDEIKRNKDIIISYIKTKENPADVATRGSTTKLLKENTLWWKGPEWLSKPSDLWQLGQQSLSSTSQVLPEKICEKSDSMVSVEEICAEPSDYCKSEFHEIEQQVESAHEVSRDASDLIKPEIEYPFGMDVERYSSVTKLLRVTAYVIKFIRKLRKKDVGSNLKSVEMKEAERIWTIYVQRKVYSNVLKGLNGNKATNLEKQLGLYIDNDGLIRCAGRLENSCLEEGARRPILLPPREKFTRLIIEKTHKDILHSGVSQTLAKIRHTYWIPHGRSIVKSTLRQCLTCRRHEGGPYRMPRMSPLPNSRVKESSAFSRTGVDYLGPLYVKSSDGSQKVWVCLFSCMVTRAIHLEIVQDMSTEELILAFKRFVSQRGVPIEIVSDNANQFKLADKTLSELWKNVTISDEFQSYISFKRINWHFIVELAPWMGGFYERLVGLVKRSLRKSLGRKLLTMIQMQTLIKEIEAVVNSRPLVYVTDDINSCITLTPSHFLTLNPDTGIPYTGDENGDKDYTPYDSSSERLLSMWKKGQKLLDEFWRIWRDDYLSSLRERTQTFLKGGRIVSHNIPNTGDIVLIKDNTPRGSWKIGVVQELVQSRDNEIRSARVQLASKKVLNRPLNLLYPIECSSTYQREDDCPKEQSTRTDKRCTERPVRQAAEVAKQKMKL